MKLEMYLNAYDSSLEDANWCEGRIQINSTFFFQHKRRVRQYCTFRARILRMDKEKDGVIVVMKMGIKYLNEKIAKKDVQISQLMELVRVVDDLRKNHLNSDYLFAMDLAKKLLKEWER